MKLLNTLYYHDKKFKVHPQNCVSLIFLLSLLLTGCQTKPQNENNPQSKNRSYFLSDPKGDRRILIPVHINDTLVANMIFDSGAALSALNFDSSFCAEHPYPAWNDAPDWKGYGAGSAWLYTKNLIKGHNSPIPIKIGQTNFTYNSFYIAPWKRISRNPNIDGLFNIPKNDTTHIWELNFENNYLEIHNIKNFKSPDNCYWLPFQDTDKPCFSIILPLKIKTEDGDTLTINRPFLVDSGMPQDIALLNEVPEVKFFDKKEAVWNRYSHIYNKRYTVEAMLFGTLPLKDLRIYTYDEAFRMDGKMSLIGLNFLKRFNVFFDIKNNRLGLQPIKNFKRLVAPLIPRFHLSIKEVNGKYLITKIADYKTNNYKIAGLQEGDEVTAINGIPYAKTQEKDAPLMKKDTLVFDILRQNKPMKFTVIPDPNEPQGD